jgi:hypothetical protein
MMPLGCPKPVPVTNAASSKRSLASASRPGSSVSKSESSRISYEPNTHAEPFCGVMTMFENVGDASATTPASASHAAFMPVEATPFHVFVAVRFTVDTARYGLALPAFVRTIVGSSVNGTR